MKLSWKLRVSGCVFLSATSVLACVSAWTYYARYALEVDSLRFEREESWGQLAQSSRELLRVFGPDRNAVLRGVLAAKHLRDPVVANEFITQLDVADPLNAELLSYLIDLRFGVLADPHGAAALCEKLLASGATNCEVRRKLLFYLAMTLQHSNLLTLSRDSETLKCGIAESYVYYFLADGLRLSNGISVTRAWLSGKLGDESLTSALAVHVARSLEGNVPAIEEAMATKVRSAQQGRLATIDSALTQFPRNTVLLAYAIGDAIENGDVERVARFLRNATPECDTDNRFWRYRGWFFMQGSNFDEALRSLDRAIELHPTDWTSRYYKAEVLRQWSDLNAADYEATMSTRGRHLERELIQQPDVMHVDPRLLLELSEYLKDCGLSEMGTTLAALAKMSVVEAEERKSSVRQSGS